MAVKITQQPDSSPLTRGRPGELSVFVRRWLVVSDGGAGEPKTTLDVSVLAAIPRPKYSRLGTAGYEATFVCVSCAVRPEPKKIYTFIVEATFHSRNNPDSCYARTSRSGGERYADLFRSASPPANGDAAWPPTASENIAGTSLDIFGAPKRSRIGQQLIVIETAYDASHLRALTGTAFPNYQAIEATYRGKRNSAPFMGWDVGKVVFQGVDESGVDDLWRVLAWRFLADEMYHLEQRVIPEPGGKPLVSTPVTYPNGDTVLSATKVRWYQPFPSKVDLWNLFNGCEQAAIQNPQPEWPSP